MSKHRFWPGLVLLVLGAFVLFWFRPHPEEPEEKPLLVISTGGPRVQTVALSPDGKMLALGISVWTSTEHTRTATSRVELRDTTTGARLLSLSIQQGYRPLVAFSPDGNTLAVSAGKIKLWDLHKGQWLSYSKGTPEGYWMVFSPDGSTLATAATGNRKGNPLLWNAHTGQLKQAVKRHGNGVVEAAFSPDSATLVSASFDNVVRLWDVKTGELKQALVGRPGTRMLSVSFSPDGRTVAGGNGTRIYLWDARTGLLRHALSPPNSVLSLAFSPDSSTIANGGIHFKSTFLPNATQTHHTIGEISLWDVQTGTLKRTLRDGHAVTDTIYSSDGKMLISTSTDDMVRLWRLK